jgi:hypothetical protein
VFARSTPKHLRASASLRARTPAPEMPNRKTKKKWANAHLFNCFFKRNRTQGRKNYVPSDFMILAFLRDKRKRNKPDEARFRPV